MSAVTAAQVRGCLATIPARPSFRASFGSFFLSFFFLSALPPKTVLSRFTILLLQPHCRSFSTSEIVSALGSGGHRHDLPLLRRDHRPATQRRVRRTGI